MTSDFAWQPDGAARGGNGKHRGTRRRPWTRKKVLALTGCVTAIFFLALFGIYEALPGRLPLGGAPAAATSPATTFYYSDGKTVLGTLSHAGRAEPAGTDPVDENIAAVKATPGAQFPSYVRVGAELQNPHDGEIIAEYPGPGQDMSAAECRKLDCYLNTAAYTREQVGSAFQPYVLAAAVADGMNATTSTLQASPYLCVPVDSQPAVRSVVMKSLVTRCPQGGYFPVENDGGAIIGNPNKGDGTTVQNALAQSSNTAFTDLTHRVSTVKVIRMAQNFGVDVAKYPNGSGLAEDLGEVGLALGKAPLTVNEQATMLSAIADNGVYHQAHMVKYWHRPDGPEQMPTVESHAVLDPSNPTTNAELDSQLQYAMEMTTVDGSGTVAASGLGNRQIIAKTGTTTSSHSGFFIGAISQYSLVVGLFTQSQDVNSPESLTPLTGGGFGGYWPAKIWNTFARAEFANLPQEAFQSPAFTGAAWNQVGTIAAPA